MIRKELATAIVLSAALGVTACKTAEPIPEEDNTEMVEESSEPVDTTAPDIKVKDKIDPVDLGSKIIASDYVEVEDESDYKVYFVAEDGDQLVLDIPSDLDKEVTEITYTFVAVDAMGNRSKEINVTIQINQPEEEVEESEAVVSQDYVIEHIDPTTMYATQACNVRSGPNTTYDVVNNLVKNQEVTVIGTVSADNGKKWYVLKTNDESIEMVSGSLLSKTKLPEGSSNNNTGNTGNTGITQQPTKPSNDCYSDCSSDCGDCDCLTGGSDCSIEWCNDMGTGCDAEAY